MFRKIAILGISIIIGTASTDVFAVGGSITDTELKTASCKNVTTGLNVTIKLPKGSASWNCGTALPVRDGETIKVTLTGTIKKKQNSEQSCKDILAANPDSTSGTYTIDPDGSGSNAPLSVYCDMETDGGGWTLVAKLFELTLPTGERNAATLVTNAQPASGQEGKLADATINALNYQTVRVIPSGAPTYITYFFNPGSQVWDFSSDGSGSGNLNGIPVCEDAALTMNCIIRNSVIDRGYAGYRNYNGTENHGFIFNHGSNLGYAGRVPYGSDYGVSATVWVR